MKGITSHLLKGACSNAKSRGFGDADVVIPPCSMQFVLSFPRWRGISRMAPGEKGSKRPRISVWAYDVRKKGRIFGSGSRGNWKAKKRLVKKSMAKKAACLHWFVCCCFLLLFNVSQWRCLLFIEFVVLESAFLLMMILHISGSNIHLIEMLFKENMFPIKGPGPFQQVCQRPIGHSSNQVSQIFRQQKEGYLGVGTSFYSHQGKIDSTTLLEIWWVDLYFYAFPKIWF